MTLKPPTRTFPKLVMKEWPEREPTEFYCPRYGAAYFGEVVSDGNVQWYETRQDDGSIVRSPLISRAALSDFTRVVEETGILNQKEAPLTKRESKHD